MTLYLEHKNIAEIKTKVFSQCLNIQNANVAPNNSFIGKIWDASMNNIQFIPDYAIVRSVAYNSTLINNAASDPNTYMIMSNISGGQDPIGTFVATATPTALGAAIVGSAGWINNPQSIIKMGKPLQNIKFWISRVSLTADDSTVTCNSTTDTLLTGNIMFVIDFIKLK